jgi:hypothetical protein
MADAVTNTTLFDGTKKLVVHLTNLSDGTGETAVIKVDKDLFVGPKGGEPSNFSVEKIKYDVQGMHVKLYLDRTTPQTLAVLKGFGEIDYRSSGGLLLKATGNTGDILLTTGGQATGDSYDITLYLKKKE